MDPLSLAASIAGLISVAQNILPLLVRYVDNNYSFPAEFTDLVAEIRGLCGVLCLLQSVIERLRTSPYTGGLLCSTELTRLDAVDLSLEQLQDCKTVLGEFAVLLQKHEPRSRNDMTKCLKSLVGALKAKKRDAVISRLERHKSKLELTLLGLYM